ncbi:hypothetical protein SS50377_24594 [Spironucleus salmonicida]|uniref:Uncharacterized protein n=1 Tax=Spironucleus salmonicida TaxID=348837 RepID=A0A9P8LQN4_9EUKA|nr:hypothetical protein SS50377_24594 [Spironucleus salmonicida]
MGCGGVQHYDGLTIQKVQVKQVKIQDNKLIILDIPNSLSSINQIKRIDNSVSYPVKFNRNTLIVEDIQDFINGDLIQFVTQ